ncbi:MAG: glycoside hydrolase N-terminal domain-containing protein, partial [Sphingobacteriaceae bacterium]|nr:glycoside hydrolase N-terminal domain-containing protein [Sphingobacteriaceae bacterium]
MKIKPLNLLLLVAFVISSGQSLLAQQKVYKLWYNQPAPELSITSMDSLNKASFIEATPVDPAWENWSLPIGNGYLGASIFGRTVTE